MQKYIFLIVIQSCTGGTSDIFGKLFSENRQIIYLSYQKLPKLQSHFPVRLPTCRSRVTTRNPSLGLTHHTYNRLQAGCYRTIDLDFKEQNLGQSSLPG
jgi:hypothetical protein